MVLHAVIVFCFFCIRPSQDISLEEFDDEDLSEITDDCGIGLNYDSDHCDKVIMELSEEITQCWY